MLVRRKRSLARNHSLFLSELDVADEKFSDWFTEASPAQWGDGEVRREIDSCTECSSFEEGEEVECSVCLSNLEKGDDTRKLGCGHRFHRRCADMWLVTGRKNTCPMCATAVVQER